MSPFPVGCLFFQSSADIMLTPFVKKYPFPSTCALTFLYTYWLFCGIQLEVARTVFVGIRTGGIQEPQECQGGDQYRDRQQAAGPDAEMQLCVCEVSPPFFSVSVSSAKKPN
jgi:hypothetical protein